MRNFSFFRRSGHSGKVRAIQIAQYLGGRVGPTEGYEDDICIFVKIRPPRVYPKHSYCDVMDEPWVLPWVKRHPDIKLIAISKTAHEYLTRELPHLECTFIPENHCNYDREVRTRKEIKTVGCIGGPNSFQFSKEEITKRFADLGLEYIHFKDYENRKDVIEFYRKIDIQVVWRQWLNFPELNNPLKLANACSFGIPTVAYPEVSYVAEFDGYFIPVETIDDLVMQVKKLVDEPEYYDIMSKKGLEIAENYHIEKMAQYYLDLRDKIDREDPLEKKEVIEIKSSPPPIDDRVKVRMNGDLLFKNVIINGKLESVYGLAHFRTRPRGHGHGGMCLRYFERLAQAAGKYAVVCFADDDVKKFYIQNGWHDIGNYKDKTVIASIPIEHIFLEEDW